MTDKKNRNTVDPPKVGQPSGQLSPRLQEHTCKVFYEHFKSELEWVEPLFNSPPSHEDPNNPESVEGKLIRDIYSDAKMMMDEIENPQSRRGPSIHRLISRSSSIAYDKGLLAYARYIRGLLGRPEDTLKAALVEAAYYSTWGKENMPIAEQEELEKIKRKEEALEAKRQAGRDSGRVPAEEKTERNEYFQNEIYKLCIEEGMGYKKATEKLSEAVKGSKWELSARRIRDYVTNPKTE